MTIGLRTRSRLRKNGWTWAGASERGTSHETTDDPKQDTVAVAEYSDGAASVMVMVVCDGAGSAKFSDIGSRIACYSAHRLIRSHIEDGKSISSIDKDLAEKWLLNIRQNIVAKCDSLETPPRELATTITIAILGVEFAILLMVGDSPCVLHNDGSWIAPIWPQRGEYANQTYFVTQDLPLRFEFSTIRKKINRCAIFSDGIEKLVMREKGKQVYQPFFDSAFHELTSDASAGRNREISRNISRFLSSDRVNQLTDDDKSLAIASRLTGC